MSQSARKVIKTSLKSILKPDASTDNITRAVLDINRLVVQTLFFMKLYLLHQYDTTGSITKFDTQFVVTILKLFTKQTRVCKLKGDNEIRKQAIRAFYNETYRHMYDKDSETNKVAFHGYMHNTFEYIATGIVTMYTNNIKMRFYDHVTKYVAVALTKKARLAAIKNNTTLEPNERKAATRHVHTQFSKIVGDIVASNATTPKKSDEEFHTWIDIVRPSIVPDRNLAQESFKYDIQCTPFDYLTPMVWMAKHVETILKTTPDEFKAKMLNVFPTRTSAIPAHIPLDTQSILMLLDGTVTVAQAKRALSCQADKLDVWSRFFKLSKRCFCTRDTRTTRYTFDCMVYTDGVACSLVLRRKDLVGQFITSRKIKPTDELYVDDKGVDADAKSKRIVAIDPNMADLLFCVDNIDSNLQTQFRYTQNQRRYECKTKRYRDIGRTIKPQAVQDIEQELSKYNHKSVDSDTYLEYVRSKNDAYETMVDHYVQPLFRKLKFSAYIRRNITETKLINTFSEKFGSPNETVVAIGDFEQRRHRKFHEPVKGKGFRTLFRKAGYSVFLVDEFKTSARCSHCSVDNAVTEPFRTTCDPRSWKKNVTRTVHGLVRCNICARLWNRDVNAACNIWKIARAALADEQRPMYMQRSLQQV